MEGLEGQGLPGSTGSIQGSPCSAGAGGELRTQIQVLHDSRNNDECGRISGIWRWWEQGGEPELLGLLHPSAGNSCPSQGSHRRWGGSWQGGGAPGRLGSPRKVGAPQEGWGALAHPGFHGDTKQRMLENLRMNSASHSIPGTCLILGKKGMLIPCSRSFLPEEH